jgi:predicted ribosome quality control (RQC) complex YloA/Tae2 family protein
MLSHYFTLQALVHEAVPMLVGSVIQEAYSQEKDELVIGLRLDAHGVVFSCRPGATVFFLSQRTARSKKNTASVFPDLDGRIIRDVRLSTSDRIVSIILDNGTTLVALLFGTAANVLLLNAEGTIIAAFRNDRQLRGLAYAAPEREMLFDLSGLPKLPSHLAGTPIASALRKTFPSFGATLTIEALFRASITPTTLAEDLSRDPLNRLGTSIQSILLETQRPVPRIYETPDGDAGTFSIIPLTYLGDMKEIVYGSVHEAVRNFVGRRRSFAALEERMRPAMLHVRQQIEKAHRTITALQEEATGVERSADYERFGTVLMSHLTYFHKGDREALIPVNDGEIAIVLDPRLSPVQNAQRYFEKAKRAKHASAHAGKRLAELREQVERGTALLSQFELVSSMTDWKNLMKERTVELVEFGLGDKGIAAPFPFRRFTVDGGFEVWVGKSSQNNDELTLHHARPRDLWFHARGASGSHVILRLGTGAGEPGKKAKEQTAAIAAYYSKMKGAGLVPVAMTEKRYVRKPKGAKPGAVTLEREEVIFARPSLPKSSSGT